MSIQKGRNPNRPAPGSSIKVEPIRKKKAIDDIKKLLNRRDRCLFTLGINTAFRANELLSIRTEQVRELGVGDTLQLKQSKTKEHRRVTLNKAVIATLTDYLEHEGSDLADNDFLFRSSRGAVLTVPTVTNMVKSWCASVGLQDNYGSHTMRKTWGWWQYKQGKPLPLLMVAYGHATQLQTLNYLCIQAEEVSELYDMEL